MNARRARLIRRYAETVCNLNGVVDHGRDAYRPQTIMGKGGRAFRFPEARLMPGPRRAARAMRRAYTRGGHTAMLGVDPRG